MGHELEGSSHLVYFACVVLFSVCFFFCVHIYCTYIDIHMYVGMHAVPAHRVEANKGSNVIDKPIDASCLAPCRELQPGTADVACRSRV